MNTSQLSSMLKLADHPILGLLNFRICIRKSSTMIPPTIIYILASPQSLWIVPKTPNAIFSLKLSLLKGQISTQCEYDCSTDGKRGKIPGTRSWIQESAECNGIWVVRLLAECKFHSGSLSVWWVQGQPLAHNPKKAAPVGTRALPPNFGIWYENQYLLAFLFLFFGMKIYSYQWILAPKGGD